MKYFVLVYDPREHSILELRPFESTERDEAAAYRMECEREHRGTDVEIVLLGAPSRAALRRTHRRYFHTTRDLATAGVEGNPVPGPRPS